MFVFPEAEPGGGRGLSVHPAFFERSRYFLVFTVWEVESLEASFDLCLVTIILPLRQSLCLHTERRVRQDQRLTQHGLALKLPGGVKG